MSSGTKWKDKALMKHIVRSIVGFTVLGVSSLLASRSIQADEPVEHVGVAVFMTLTEPLMDKHCSLANVGGGPGQGFCGSGEVVPLGHAEETIEFGGGCGGGCDLRTINLPEGSIFIEETFTFLSSHGTTEVHNGNQPPFSGSLADVIIGGTGIFEGATGSLSGTVRVAGKANQVKLSGTIILAVED
jgi:hypothetical protein